MDKPQGTSARADTRDAPRPPTVAPAEGLSNRPQIEQSQQSSGAYTGASESATTRVVGSTIGILNQEDEDRRCARCEGQLQLSTYVSARGHPSEHRSVCAHFGGRYQNAGGPRFPSGFVSGSVPCGPNSSNRSVGWPIIPYIAFPSSDSESQSRILDVVRGQGLPFAGIGGPRIPDRPLEGTRVTVLQRQSLVYGVRPMITFPGDSPQGNTYVHVSRFASVVVSGGLPPVRIGERFAPYNRGGRALRRVYQQRREEQ